MHLIRIAAATLIVAGTYIPTLAQQQPKATQPTSDPIVRDLVFRRPLPPKPFSEGANPVTPPGFTPVPNAPAPKVTAQTKAQHLLQAADHLEQAGRLDEAEKLRSEAAKLTKTESLRQKMAELERLQKEIAALKKKFGYVDTIRLDAMLLEAVPEKLSQANIDLADLLIQENKGEIALTSGTDRPRRNSRLHPIIKLANAGSNVLQRIGELKEEGVFRTLYEPTIVTVSGQPAQFHSGGEFPVPGVVDKKQIIVWRSFGTRLAFEPTSIGERKIRLKFIPEVSRRVPQKGTDVPGLNSWRVQTNLEVELGQTIVMNAQPHGGKEMLILVTASEGQIGDRAKLKPYSASYPPVKQ